MTVARILKSKKDTVFAVEPGEPLQAVIDTFASHQASAVVVLNAQHRIEGVITERDVVYALARDASCALTLRADDIMRRDVKTCSYNTREAELMKIMVESNISALPVVADQVPIGIVSMRDVLKLRMEMIEQLMKDIERDNQISCPPQEAIHFQQ